MGTFDNEKGKGLTRLPFNKHLPVRVLVMENSLPSMDASEERPEGPPPNCDRIITIVRARIEVPRREGDQKP